MFLRRLVGILRVQGILKTPWRNNPAAIIKVATIKIAMGRVVGITNRKAILGNKLIMAKLMNLASNNRALTRVAQLHLLIKCSNRRALNVDHM